MNPTPVETFVRARRLGIIFRLGDEGEIFARLPEGWPPLPRGSQKRSGKDPRDWPSRSLWASPWSAEAVTWARCSR